MLEITYRRANALDIPAMAQLRTGGWGYVEFWTPRVTAYVDGTSQPQHALPTRILFIATAGHQPVGFIAGHLTTRFGCQGELQWVDVAANYRAQGIASHLLNLLAAWFVAQNALKVCVNVDPDNTGARALYKKLGAKELDAHWMVWDNIGLYRKPGEQQQ